MRNEGRARQTIVVAGAGIAGSLIISGLAGRRDVEVICLERVGERDHADAGTGLNVGPNAMKCLAAHMPERARAIRDNSLPWRRWTVGLTDGTALMDLPLDRVADGDGIRIRWAELYDLLRTPIRPHVRFDAAVEGCAWQPDGRAILRYRDQRTGEAHDIPDVDLVVAAEGRYSPLRQLLSGENPPLFLGVCLYRLLFPVGPDCPIDDYGQWFNGPNRLLAFRVPGDFVYCAGSFPIPPDSGVPEDMKSPEALCALYRPASGALAPEPAFLVDAIRQHHRDIHWARLQEGEVRFTVPGRPVLYVGDAAHPMVPTLGQGATQGIEDACVAAAEIASVLDEGGSLADVPARVEARRADRIRFVVDFSRQATDTMLTGADPVAGTLRKTERPFLDRLERLYRDVPAPRAHAASETATSAPDLALSRSA